MKLLTAITIITLVIPLIVCQTVSDDEAKHWYQKWEEKNMGRELTSDDVNHLYDEWQKHEGRQYKRSIYVRGRSEKDIEFEAFKENLEEVIEFNKEHNSTFKKGLNKFSGMTDEEKKKLLNVDLDAKSIMDNNKHLPVIEASREDLPESLDWEAQGVLNPVRDQGQCGSCYSFAAVAAIEAAYAIKYSQKPPPQFSEQQLVDCTFKKIDLDGAIGNYGCDGGYYRHSLSYLETAGTKLLSDYPYTGTVGECKDSASNSVVNVTGIYTSTHQIGDVEAMKAALNKGPLMAYIYVNDDFYSYATGVYDGPNCRSDPTSCPVGYNHAIVLVGYGKTDDGIPYWKVRNSWGTHWGENGYFKIGMGKNVCCIEGSTVYATVV